MLEIIERAQKNPFEFGSESYDYKNLKQKEKMKITGYMSGTFDLFHIGHLNIIKKAKSFIVIL